MRRQDIQLRSLAKQGDVDACLKLGESYLAGTAGFARNIQVALTYLRAALPLAPRAAALAVVRHMPLQEILEHDQLDVLKTAAEHSDAARLKLAAWYLVGGDSPAAKALIDRCANLSFDALARRRDVVHGPVAGVLQAIGALQPMDLADVVVRAGRKTLAEGRLDRTVQIFDALPEPYDGLPLPVLQPVVDALRHAEQHALPLGSLPITLVESALERVSSGGDLYACNTLGRALAGLRCGELPPERLVVGPQLRKAVALLLRAADGGTPTAWLHLYRICADYRGSVANPMMARFCLEKAAQHGIAEAERRLGALELREARAIEPMERAVSLLSLASRKGDGMARVLLQSLVLPVEGDDAAAQTAMLEVQRIAPLLAMRLRLARHFGLTKLEALSVDPSLGQRPWGLVVGKNPFVVKMRLAEPRAVLAISEAAMACLVRAATVFGSAGEATAVESPLRARSIHQRRIFERLGLDDAMFFASATSQQRDAIRVGTKWAQKQRQTLQMALAN
jgi:TPR repeat protein